MTDTLLDARFHDGAAFHVYHREAIVEAVRLGVLRSNNPPTPFGRGAAEQRRTGKVLVEKAERRIAGGSRSNRLERQSKDQTKSSVPFTAFEGRAFC